MLVPLVLNLMWLDFRILFYGSSVNGVVTSLTILRYEELPSTILTQLRNHLVFQEDLIGLPCLLPTESSIDHHLGDPSEE